VLQKYGIWRFPDKTIVSNGAKNRSGKHFLQRKGIDIPVPS
jgi:hypothetical protein